MLAGITISSSGRTERFSFTFGCGAFRDDDVFDSANCPPSRYLVEVGRRMRLAAPDAEALVIGNPLLPLDPARLDEWLGGIDSLPAIVSDAEKFPLLYVFPRAFFDEWERFLLLLSTVDAATDESLLARIAGRPIAHARSATFAVGKFPNATATNWFQSTSRQQMLKILCLAAVSTMERNPGWRTLPFACYLPYHAGSVLFLNLASRQVENGFFDKVIICSSYRDIHRSCPGSLDPVWLRLPWLPRDNSVGELEYLVHSLERLGQDFVDNHFIVFMRYSRVYSVPPFHLIDQLKFALGDSMREREKTVHGRLPVKSSRPDLPAAPLKLLFHLTGGWKLKSFRDDHAHAVFMTLKALGCEISVIDRPDQEKLGVRSITSDDTDLLTAAVRQHHIFIGVDSFPHHFVRHVLGWPTIGLFANTKPCNSDARDGPDYKGLAAWLPCNPCGANERCPLNGSAECANFVEPTRLVATILDMAHDLYGFTP